MHSHGNRGAADGGILKDAGPAPTYQLNINSRQRGIAQSAVDLQPRLLAPSIWEDWGVAAGRRGDCVRRLNINEFVIVDEFLRVMPVTMAATSAL